MQKLEELVAQLPPDIYRQVQDYAEFLLQKRAARTRSQPGFQWAGALKDLCEQYTSTQLQHAITEWRIAEGKGSLDQK